MSAPFISILLPVKNASPFLKACLDSILKQSTKDWELLAVDDHSADESLAILNTYAVNDSRIKVYKNKAQGIIPALRLAYANAQGQLITRMDADDLMIPNKLALLKQQLLEKGKGYIATGLVAYFSSEELGDGYLKYQNWLNELSIREKNFTDIYKECVIPSPCWMLYKSDLDACGAFAADRYPEDYDLCFRFYKHNLKVTTVPQVLHQWRDHQNRTSRNDPKYANIHFFDLKVDYFLQVDYLASKSLLLWGAGKKGKKLAKLFLEHQITFRWITDNEKKIGKHIYDVKIEASTVIKFDNTQQLIIAIATPEVLVTIKSYLAQKELVKSEDYFLFC